VNEISMDESVKNLLFGDGVIFGGRHLKSCRVPRDKLHPYNLFILFFMVPWGMHKPAIW
jgi:hypothetical protein